MGLILISIFSMNIGMMCEPLGALVIGALSGVISVLGYKYLTVIMKIIMKSDSYLSLNTYLFILSWKSIVWKSVDFSNEIF